MTPSDPARDAYDGWPSVSAVVCTRDRPELLRKAIAAILGQDYEGRIECIVVFDKSEPDQTLVVAGEQRSVRVTRNDHTPGLAGGRNAGAAVARGELIAFCDDDDEWLPDKTRLQVLELRRTGAAVCVSGIYLCHGGSERARVPARSDLTLAVLARRRVGEARPSTVIVTREAFFGSIGQVDEKIPGSYGEDYDWILRASQAGTIACVEEPLVRILIHPGSFFTVRWQTTIEGLDYCLAKHPVLSEDSSGLARIYGQKAFAHAALHDGVEARRWIRRALRLNWRERRAFLAFAVSLHLLKAETVLRLANSVGRGI